MTNSLIDRSLVFSCLLNQSPAFASMTTEEGSEVITRVVEDWRRAEDHSDMFEWVKQWLATHDLGDEPKMPTRVTAREAARMLGVHYNTIRNWCREGILPHSVMPDGRIRLWREDIEKFVRSLADQPTRQVSHD